jgi:hypothetical protein
MWFDCSVEGKLQKRIVVNNRLVPNPLYNSRPANRLRSEKADLEFYQLINYVVLDLLKGQ